MLHHLKKNQKTLVSLHRLRKARVVKLVDMLL